MTETDDGTTIGDVLRSPLTWLASVLSIGLYDPTFVAGIATATWANLPSLFTLTSIAGLTLPKYWPPETTAEKAIIAIGVLFAAKIALKIYRTYDRELEEE